MMEERSFFNNDIIFKNKPARVVATKCLHVEKQVHLFSRLPRLFIKRSNGDFHKDATLKDNCGNLWHMEVEKDEKDVSLKHGWPKFANDFSLEFGDFLIFTHNGNSQFEVKVYGKNRCLKEIRISNREKNNELEMILMPVKLEDKPNEGKNRPKSIHDCNKKAKDLCEAPQGKSRRTALSVYEESKTTDLSDFFMTKNLHFVASIRPETGPYHLYIPKHVLKEVNLKPGQKMVLGTQDGKKWPVRIRLDAERCTRGWKIFWTGNNLEPEDQCRFEFSFNKNGTLNEEIFVTILRAKTKK